MPRRSILSSTVACAVLLAAAFAPAPSRGQRSAPDAPAVIVVMRGLHSDRGMASAGLYASAETWTHAGREVATCHAAVANGVSRCRLENVPPGRYAIGVMHDENSNGRFDTGFLGIPNEGYGFSRDARGTLGSPSFDSAAFEYDGGRLIVPITMHYGI